MFARLPFSPLPPEVRSAWQVGMDTPHELAFAGLIGRAEGLTAPDDALDIPRASSAAEREWQEWWERLLTDNISVRLDRALSDAPHPVQPDEFAERVRSAGLDQVWDPPKFVSLANWPLLRALCQLHWPTFSTWDRVDGEKMRLNDMLSASMQRLDLNRMVYHCVRAVGRRVSAPFKLRLDVIPWPEDYHRRIGDEHVVLGSSYLAAKRAEALRALLASYIIRLV